MQKEQLDKLSIIYGDNMPICGDALIIPQEHKKCRVLNSNGDDILKGNDIYYFGKTDTLTTKVDPRLVYVAMLDLEEEVCQLKYPNNSGIWTSPYIFGNNHIIENYTIKILDDNFNTVAQGKLKTFLLNDNSTKILKGWIDRLYTVIEAEPKTNIIKSATIFNKEVK